MHVRVSAALALLLLASAHHALVADFEGPEAYPEWIASLDNVAVSNRKKRKRTQK